MKRLFYLCLIILVNQYVNAQGVSLNENGTPALSSAMLDISSTTKGVLVPRMTGAQRNMINAPDEGLLVYDTDSRSFWFFASGWQEIAGGGMANGPATGDLSGNYPSPTVSKIQNLDVAFGVPFDQQVLKWDALANNWKGRNDSLFLPYQATTSGTGTLFSVTNTYGGDGATTIMGRRYAGCGVTPAFSIGVWGDNEVGAGVVGTSEAGIGTFGLSFLNHGVYGQSNQVNFAGVYGTHSAENGTGIMGYMSNYGNAIYGVINATHGNSGRFVAASASHIDTSFQVVSHGTGMVSAFAGTNSASTNPIMNISNAGSGNSISLLMNKVSGTGNGIDIYNYGQGIGVNSKSEKGSAGNFEIVSATNSNNALNINTIGTGKGLNVSSTHASSTSNIVDISSMGSGNALNVQSQSGRAANFVQSNTLTYTEAMYVKTLGFNNAAKFVKENDAPIPSNDQAAVLIENISNAPALRINSTNGTSVKHAFDINHNGQAYAAKIWSNDGGLSVQTNSTTKPVITSSNLIGAIAFKGTSSSNWDNTGTVMGVNESSGVAIYGEATNSFNGTGVEGRAKGSGGYGVDGINQTDGIGVRGTSYENGIGVLGIAGNGSGGSGLLGRAGVFTLSNANNATECLTASHYGLGVTMLIDAKNAVSGQPALRVKSANNAPFATFETSGGTEKLVFEKPGNIIADGTITVRENKGIVRNTYSSQLRVESTEVSFDAPPALEIFTPLEYRELTVTFNTAFPAPPNVFVGNYTGGVNGNMLDVHVRDVTNTGCKVWIQNQTSQNVTVGDHGWKLMIMGIE